MGQYTESRLITLWRLGRPNVSVSRTRGSSRNGWLTKMLAIETCTHTSASSASRLDAVLSRTTRLLAL